MEKLAATISSLYINQNFLAPRDKGEKDKNMKNITIKNLTPHTITIYSKDKTTVLLSVPPEGVCPRVSTTQETVGEINAIPVQRVVYGSIEGLPEQQPDTIFIVSQMVLSALNGSRPDVFAPDTGKGAVRDKDGRILGTTNFVTL